MSAADASTAGTGALGSGVLYRILTVGIHNRKAAELEKEITGLPERFPVENHQVRLRLLAALLKAGDSLHADESRVRGPHAPAPGSDAWSKYLARRAMQGWVCENGELRFVPTPESLGEFVAVMRGIRITQAEEWDPIYPVLRDSCVPCTLLPDLTCLRKEHQRILDVHKEWLAMVSRIGDIEKNLTCTDLRDLWLGREIWADACHTRAEICIAFRSMLSACCQHRGRREADVGRRLPGDYGGGRLDTRSSFEPDSLGAPGWFLVEPLNGSQFIDACRQVAEASAGVTRWRALMCIVLMGTARACDVLLALAKTPEPELAGMAGAALDLLPVLPSQDGVPLARRLADKGRLHREVAQTLAQYGSPEDLERLLPLAGATDAAVVESVAVAVAKWGTPEHLSVAAELAEHEAAQARPHAMRAVAGILADGELTQSGRDVLWRLACTPNADTRGAAEELLGRHVQLTDMADLLRRMGADGHESAAAGKVLERLVSRQSDGERERLAEHDDPRVRRAVVRSFVKGPDTRLAEVYAELASTDSVVWRILDDLSRDEDDGVREAVSQAAGALQPAVASDLLTRLSDDHSARVRVGVAGAAGAGALPVDLALKLLHQMERDASVIAAQMADDEEQEAGTDVPGRAGDPISIDPLNTDESPSHDPDLDVSGDIAVWGKEAEAADDDPNHP